MKKTPHRSKSNTSLPKKVRRTFLQESLVEWFQHNQRDLPWRRTKDSYAIWISEVMLQQTTSQAVIPYFQKFLKKFPTVHALALAPEKDVLAQWAGLGYYSRARNLHKAAKSIHQQGFPQTAEKLLELPGFGPYTSRAVASFAFDERVGVLDGNVIRILSRVTGRAIDWWTTSGRQELQTVSDELAETPQAATINQAMMELGATLCTPQSPSCFLCPWQKVCEARQQNTVEQLPLKKPKQESHILLWTPQILRKKNQIAFIKNNYTPFLKNSLILPGSLKKLNQRPVRFDLKHMITKYEIFIRIDTKSKKTVKNLQQNSLEWLDIAKITEEIPYSLIHKTLQAADRNK